MSLTAAKIKAQIHIIRNGASLFLIDSCSLLRKTGETVTNGESFPIYADPVTLDCRLIIRSGSEVANVAAQMRQVEQSSFTSLFKMQIPYGTQITENDIIIYHDKELDRDRRLQVVYAPPHNEFTGALVITLQEVK